MMPIVGDYLIDSIRFDLIIAQGLLWIVKMFKTFVIREIMKFDDLEWH